MTIKEITSISELIDCMAMVELDPCPFCGGAVKTVYFDEEMCLRNEYDERVEYGGVMCENCNLTMTEQLITQGDIQDVIKRWNKRVKE